ncbi:hypothetical protein COOONC_02092 [Cooperia oncophora]
MFVKYVNTPITIDCPEEAYSADTLTEAPVSSNFSFIAIPNIEGQVSTYQRPGFNRKNFDQTKRIENQQENINRTVMSKLVRIVAVPNKEKRNVKEAAEFFLKEVVKSTSPLSWH